MKPAPVIVDFLRHGQVTGVPCFNGVTDPPLTQGGWDAMTQACKTSKCVDGIITSPLRRCATFAHEWGRHHRIPVTIASDWREYDFGLWDGRTTEEIMALDPHGLAAFWRDPTNHPPPHGEPMAHFQARIAASVQVALHVPAKEHLLVITHGGVMRQLAAQLLQRPFQEMWSMDIPPATMLRTVLVPGGKTASPKLLYMGSV
ncbi:MAG: histidine phosphatase family protein [Nitrospirae bacterium]|nr:histidine phosphatase family protein [Magnetococcales bacterium]